MVYVFRVVIALKMSLFKKIENVDDACAEAMQHYNEKSWSDVGQFTMEKRRMSATFLYCKGRSFETLGYRFR